MAGKQQQQQNAPQKGAADKDRPGQKGKEAPGGAGGRQANTDPDQDKPHRQ